MASSVSVHDVAALAGVSIGTVSNVLNRPEKVTVVCQGQGGHPQFDRFIHQPVDPAASVQKAVVRVDMEMDEIRVNRRHSGTPKTASPQAQGSMTKKPLT